MSILFLLARAFLAGEPTVDGMVERASYVLGRPWGFLRPLAQRFLEATRGRTRPRWRETVEFLDSDRTFARVQGRLRDRLRVEHWLTPQQRMQPVQAAAGWQLPPIETAGALAGWLEVEPRELDWFADLKALGYKNPNPLLRHYHYRVFLKQSGELRLVEAPKQRLKKIQRQILTEILDRIRPHPAVHGFRKGRSIRTFAAPHAGQRVVVRMDLRNFFPSIAGARVQAFFRTAGYPEQVADLLGGLCTNAVPRDVWRTAPCGVSLPTRWHAFDLYARPHLPQGAPTSPALANLLFYRVDCRLRGLAESAGAVYTRYADDLAFSGGAEFERTASRFALRVSAILEEEGFAAHPRKTRIMRQGVRQHLAGLVTNRHLSIVRADYDRLKAILTNCIRTGPAGQNREGHADFRGHLTGRVAYVGMINPARGRRLRNLLDQIAWS
jgi:RNA-directed DNA polymerase